MIGYSWGKIKGALSGWEKSHFGGYHKLINDYPYIKLDFTISIELSKSIGAELGNYTGEKLIKLYLIKAKSLGIISVFHSDIRTIVNPFTGKEQKFEVIYLRHLTAMTEICTAYPEYAPLFEHFRDGILETNLIKRLEDKEESPNPEGNGPKDDSEKETKEEEKSKSLKEVLSDIQEHKPYTAKWDKGLSGWEGGVKWKAANFTNHSKEYRFTAAEIKDAENLLKMLDISFEPKSDIVKSLRAGKLDVCKIAEVPAGSTSIYKQTIEDQDTKPFGVCILADMSGSMCDGIRLPMQKHTLNALYLALSQIIPSDKLWIYAHSGDEDAEIYQFHTPYETNYALNIACYGSIDNAQNYDGPVIEAIHKKVRETSDDRIIFISLSDGYPSGENYGHGDDIDDMKRILEKARRDDFVTVGIGMQHMGIKDLYNISKCVSDMKFLARDVSQVINQLVRQEFK